MLFSRKPKPSLYYHTVKVERHTPFLVCSEQAFKEAREKMIKNFEEIDLNPEWIISIQETNDSIIVWYRL